MFSISSKLQAFLVRAKPRLQPHVLFDNKAFSFLLGVSLLLMSIVVLSRNRRLALRIAASRRLETGLLRKLGAPLIRPWLAPNRSETWRNRKIGWDRYFGGFGNIENDPSLTTSLILKEPGENGEKGVIYCSFEFNWMKLIASPNSRDVFRDYILVGASSWSPTDNAVFANLCGLSEDPAFIGISNVSDLEQYKLFKPYVFPLPIMACDWIDPGMFRPRRHNERTIDILMVAHFAYWKRHWLLFRALRKMREDLRVVLVGRNAPGRTETEIRNEAKAFGVRQDLTILRNLEIEEVISHQCNAKVSVALSKREGSCVSVTESMFADAPVVMMRDSHIGARAYINPLTGRLAGPSSLHYALSRLIEGSDSVSPLAWAKANISAQATSSKLNGILRDYMFRKGRPWTRNIAPLCWRYVPRYLDREDARRLLGAPQRFQERYGIALEEFVSEKLAMRKAS